MITNTISGSNSNLIWFDPGRLRFSQMSARLAWLPLVAMSAEDMPRWKPSMVNQFDQDDLYVEMTYLRTLEVYGLDVCIRQAGIDLANSGYMLWHANRRGRMVLRQGIAPPDSGHPRFNPHADDIDYQIQADFSGLIAPSVTVRNGPTMARQAATGRQLATLPMWTREG